jgi:hypothetical protein
VPVEFPSRIDLFFFWFDLEVTSSNSVGCFYRPHRLTARGMWSELQNGGGSFQALRPAETMVASVDMMEDIV